MFLVIVDTTGIQSYIFGSNRLRENVGASFLVHQATEGWLMQTPDAFLPPGRHNIRDDGRNDTLAIEKGDLDAELLYAGGGNTILLFRNLEDVKRFGRELSKRLIVEAPGLDAAIVSHPFSWTDNLACALQAAMEQMARQKQERARSQPLLGLGVTAACASTGLAANDHKPEPGEIPTVDRARLSISAEVSAKWGSNIPAKERLKAQLPSGPYDYPDDFDHLGRTEGEQSYIGVVHADGNGMGKLLEGITEGFAAINPPENRAYISKVRDFSDSVNKIGVKALRAVVDYVKAWNQRGEELDQAKERPRPGEIALLPGKRRNKDGQEETCISIRPIVFGGDDVTFVCDGRIALQAAKVFLDAFGQEKIEGKPAVACAGVAIVKSHYPFARAYELAEELTKNAKNQYQRSAAAIDWYLAQSGLYGDLSHIRAAEYEFKPATAGESGNREAEASDASAQGQESAQETKEPKQTLLMRPLVIGEALTLPKAVAEKEGRWRTWDNFVALLQTFQQSPQNSDKGKWPRNKVMALRTELAASRWDPERSALGQHIAQIGRPPQTLELPAVANAPTGYQEKGWVEEPEIQRCVYYDAIESIEQMIAYGEAGQ